MPLETEKNDQSINLLNIGEADSKLPSPINLDIRNTKEVTLPSLRWNNADEVPRLMKISNSGHSVIITAKWFGPYRPYITGSNLPGTYIFSQAHFHWGKDDSEGSEHTIDGTAHPLELHVMYFKTDYGTQEKAMKELDGIIVLAYLYNIRKQRNEGLEPIVAALPKAVQPFTSSAIALTPMSKIAPIFTDDYYLYWGSVSANTAYRILWFINREAQNVSTEQLSFFRKLMGANKHPLLSNFRDIKPMKGRRIFHVNPRNTTRMTLIEALDPPHPSTTDKQGSKGIGRRNKGSDEEVGSNGSMACSFGKEQLEVQCGSTKKERTLKHMPVTEVACVIGRTEVLLNSNEILMKLQHYSGLKRKQTCPPRLDELGTFTQDRLNEFDVEDSHDSLSLCGMKIEVDQPQNQQRPDSVAEASDSVDIMSRQCQPFETVCNETQAFPTNKINVLECSTFRLVTLPELQFAEVSVRPIENQEKLQHAIIESAHCESIEKQFNSREDPFNTPLGFTRNRDFVHQFAQECAEARRHKGDLSRGQTIVTTMFHDDTHHDGRKHPFPSNPSTQCEMRSHSKITRRRRHDQAQLATACMQKPAWKY